jgi:hypothetical protein
MFASERREKPNGHFAGHLRGPRPGQQRTQDRGHISTKLFIVNKKSVSWGYDTNRGCRVFGRGVPNLLDDTPFWLKIKELVGIKPFPPGCRSIRHRGGRTWVNVQRKDRK